MPFDTGVCYRRLRRAVLLAGFFVLGRAPSAEALPSFARQTGQPCGACHTDFPALTPYGRRFKLAGYTMGGGRYQTTLFPTTDDHANEKEYVPPISMMSIVGYTHTQAAQPPPTAPFNANDNVVLSPFSGFWGGAITDNIGAFAQMTYNGQPPGGSGGDPFTHDWSWDNTDLRLCQLYDVRQYDIIFGITANNNPTVQDLWNTTPAWNFPYAVSNIAPTPGAGTIIDGAFAAHVGSAGAYVFIDDMLYLEASAYRTLGSTAQNDLGVDPFDAPGQFMRRRYWRVAFEPHWGNNCLRSALSECMPMFIPGPCLERRRRRLFRKPINTPILASIRNISIRARIFGSRSAAAIFASIKNWTRVLPMVSPPTRPTSSISSPTVSFAYGGDNRVVFTGQYFNTWGTPDITLYSGLASGSSPNSNGWIAEIAYIPFGISQAPGWPWLNARIGLDYIAYTNSMAPRSVPAATTRCFFTLVGHVRRLRMHRERSAHENICSSPLRSRH